FDESPFQPPQEAQMADGISLISHQGADLFVVNRDQAALYAPFVAFAAKQGLRRHCLRSGIARGDQDDAPAWLHTGLKACKYGIATRAAVSHFRSHRPLDFTRVWCDPVA